MNKLYTKNLRYLKKISPQIYEKLLNVDDNLAKSCRCNNGKINIIRNYNGNDLFVHSSYNPEQQARFISENALESGSHIIVLFGFGLAYELREMMKKDRKRRYFIIEPDLHVFKVALQNIDFQTVINMNSNITFMVEDNAELIDLNLRFTINEEKTTDIKLVILPYYQEVYKELIAKTFELISKTIRITEGNIVIELEGDRQLSLNYVRNAQYLYETLPLETLTEYLKGVPAVIVGAGPSVEYSLKYLEKIKDKALIVPASNGNLVLDNNNIKAHFAGAMDGWQTTQKVYENLDINRNINLMYSSQLFSTVPSLVKGKKFLMSQVYMDAYIKNKLNWYNDFIFSGPSITNVLAFNLARIGCNPIIFLGQDLCLKGKKSYADGTIYDEVNENEYKITKNVKGERVYTTRTFLSMKNSMEDVIKMNSSTKYLNATEHGLHIEGSEDIDFGKYIDEFLINRQDIELDKILDECFEKNKELNSKEKIDKFIIDLKTDIETLSSLFRDIILFIESNETEKIKEKYINKKEKELEKNEFYTSVLFRRFKTTIDLLYNNKKYIEMKKNTYLYYLDKCNVMINGIDDLYRFS